VSIFLRQRVLALKAFNRDDTIEELPSAHLTLPDVRFPDLHTTVDDGHIDENDTITDWRSLKMIEPGEVNGVRFFKGTMINASAEDADRLISSGKAIVVDNEGNPVDTTTDEMTETEVAETEAAETEVAETEVTETEVTETEVTETEVTETEVTETEVTETEVTETEVAETEVTETEVTETEVAETEAAEAEVTETEVAETEAAEAEVTETEAAETEVTEKSAADHLSVNK
jgi:hypothetical protein